MAKVFIEETTLTAIGDAIRGKEGTTDLVPVTAMATRITDLPEGGGGGGYVPTDEELTIKWNCSRRFANNGWNWVIENYGDRITTKDLRDCSYMFSESYDLEEIPFTLNVEPLTESAVTYDFSRLFYYCSNLKAVPVMRGSIKPPTNASFHNPDLSYFFSYCTNLREIPHDYFNNFLTEEWFAAAKGLKNYRARIFEGCYSLRRLPDLRRLVGGGTSSSNSLYYYMCKGCYALDEATNIPVHDHIDLTSNMFTNTFTDCKRLKNCTFETNEDGTPKTARWKSQTINLTGVGYFTSSSDVNNLLNNNSGITADKRVGNEIHYAALKDDPDWYAYSTSMDAYSIAYSRYNKTSAIETINSLPDTSAYGTNTIKFTGLAGNGTDGGGINTMTEEEIAVAAAKGWTVTFA